MSPACLFSYYVEARKGKVHKTQAPVLHARGPALKSAHIWVSGENTIRETCCGLPLSRSCSHDPGSVPSYAPPLLRDGRHSCASVGAEHAPSCATTPYRVTAGLHDHSSRNKCYDRLKQPTKPTLHSSQHYRMGLFKIFKRYILI